MTRTANIYVAITTYNRPKELEALISDVARELKGTSYHVRVYDDASDERVYVPYDCVYYSKNNGKQGYWRIMNAVFRDAQEWNFKYFFFLQDDCRLSKGFFDHAIQEFEAIEDPNKATMCTFTPESIYDRVMWSTNKAQDIVFSGSKFIKCNYVDCIFMCPRTTLQMLSFKMDMVPPARFSNNNISSGVGQQITARLIRLRKTMYCAWSSLVISHSNDSKMNKEERKKNPLTPLIREREKVFVLSDLLKNIKEKVTVGIASIKSREQCLYLTVACLLDQVDEMHIYLNDYDHVPKFLENEPKIKFYLGKIYKDRGDTAKYYALDKCEEGYYFSCDDDLVYPHDYVEKTIKFLKEHDNKVIATYHGAILKRGKLNNYYRDRKQIHYSNFQRSSIPVNIGGTGVMAFHVNEFRPDTKKFLYPNMADVWVGIQAQEKDIPILCAPRILNWIKSQDVPPSETIYGSKSNHDLQTEVINNFKSEHGEFTNI